MSRVSLAAMCLIAAGFSIQPLLAQSTDADGLTEAEILERFQQQKTRGLSIAPVGETAAADGTATAAAATAVSGMQILPEDQQVNINISFDFDSAALRDDQKPRLVELCGAMQAMDGASFRILGHTDASGSDAYNQRLSKLRAEEVKRFLVSDCGVSPDRLEATGVGEQFPLDPDDPRADVNRRVEFQLIG